jgi:integrase
VWRRTLAACGVRYRKLYSQRHTFLSHTLAAGNSPADVAAIAGHARVPPVGVNPWGSQPRRSRG